MVPRRNTNAVSRAAAPLLLLLLAATPAMAGDCGYDGCFPPRAYYGGYTYHYLGLAPAACCGADGVYYPDAAYDWGLGYDYAAGKPPAYDGLTGVPPNFQPPRELYRPPICLKRVPTAPRHARWAWRRNVQYRP
ncbi:MAG TPA: hypothetical protein VK446_04795 [Methylocystis sp.]|nr:hypothetical protein [Methylocystis sp.]